MKSQEKKNLEYASNSIVRLAKEKGFIVKGPKFMPKKHLLLTGIKSPCGEGTNTYNKYMT